jgi:V8-like Glu-specific endopeptidase
MLKKVKILLVICLLFSAIVTSNVQADLSQAPTISGWEQEGATIEINATLQEQQDVLKQWTLDERMAAEPMDLPVIAAEEIGKIPDGALTIGEAGFAPGGLPDPRADAVAQRAFPEEWRASIPEAGVEENIAPFSDSGIFGTPAIFTGYAVNRYKPMWKKYPYYAIGKLYFYTPGGRASCTASVISPNNIIVTAAHCLIDASTGLWYSGWSFIPASRIDAAPYGTFPWKSARILTAYVTSGGDTQYDMGLITLGKNKDKKYVTYYTGWLGSAWNYDYVRHLHAFGYPSNLEDGKYTYTCAAESFYGATDVLGMGCNMTYGSSGGPWIMHFAPHVSGAVNYVNSVVSGGVPGTNTFYGPRFTDYNFVLLCTDEGCW